MITPLGMQSCGNCQDKCEVGRCYAGRGWCCDWAEERPTTGAVDLGDSSAIEVGSTPEVLSAGQGESTPAPNH